MPKYPLRTSPPWHFRLAKWLIRNRIRGGFQIIELAERMGWLDFDCRYKLSEQVSVDVPQASVAFGTNGGTAPTRPTTIPIGSDTELVTLFLYDDASGRQNKARFSTAT